MFPMGGLKQRLVDDGLCLMLCAKKDLLDIESRAKDVYLIRVVVRGACASFDYVRFGVSACYLYLVRVHLDLFAAKSRRTSVFSRGLPVASFVLPTGPYVHDALFYCLLAQPTI